MAYGLKLVSNEKFHIMTNGALLIRDTDETDANNYTCQVENEHGQDQITYSLEIYSTPGIPYVEVALITTTSIDIQWKISKTGGSQILGYKLYYKYDHNNWETIEIDASASSYRLNGLQCGTQYQIEMLAYNKLGQGKLSSIITAATKGGVPVPPTKKLLIEDGSTFISMNLDSWLVDKCQIKYFVVEYKSQSSNQWRLLSDDVKPEKRKLVLSDLSPATWYNLRMIAHSSAGPSASEYTFATLTSDGATIAPDIFADDAQFRPIAFQLELKHMVAVISSILIIILIGVIVWICAQTKKSKKHNQPKSGRRYLNGTGSESGSDMTYDGSYGYSFGNSTLSRDPRGNRIKGDLTPYATGNLTDHYQPEELAAMHLHHSMAVHGDTLSRMTVPFYPQGHSRVPVDGFGNGVFPSTVDVVNFQGQLQQIPSIPSMGDVIPVRNSKTSQPNTPKHVTSGKATNLSLPQQTAMEQLVCETTFNLPPPQDMANTGEKNSIGKYDAPWDVKGQIQK